MWESVEIAGKSAAELRDALASNLIRPLGLVLLTRERIQEVADDAVRRGRMTADDAEDLVRNLIDRGRRQTDELMRELEGLLGRAFQAAGLGGEGGGDAGGGEAGGDAFPIPGYDELNATEVRKRLEGLGADELRQVREHEARNRNRKTVLAAIDKQLS